jgi:hypothetical protein
MPKKSSTASSPRHWSSISEYSSAAPWTRMQGDSLNLDEREGYIAKH